MYQIRKIESGRAFVLSGWHRDGRPLWLPVGSEDALLYDHRSEAEREARKHPRATVHYLDG